MEPSVGVVIVTYNSAHVVGALLESLPAALDGVPSTIVVVDNGSSDDSVAVVEAHGGCTVVRSTNRGYAAGINTGVREVADADSFLVLNPDVVLRPGSVRRMQDALAQPGVGIVVPQVRNDDRTLFRSLRKTPRISNTMGLGLVLGDRFREYLADPTAYEHPHLVDWALGAVMLVSRSCDRLLGGWDESFFLYSEETDLSLRAADIGLSTWFEPAAVAVHVGGQSGTSDRTHVMQIVNQVRLYRRRHALAPSAVFWALTIAREALWCMRGNTSSRAAIVALARPSRRPAELAASDHLVPR